LIDSLHAALQDFLRSAITSSAAPVGMICKQADPPFYLLMECGYPKRTKLALI